MVFGTSLIVLAFNAAETLRGDPTVYVEAAADAIYDESIQVGHLVLRYRGTVYSEVTWITKED